ncbi:MAG: hypothetical protein IT454_02090 [Planctomycetes bacterium]|nr:hypothetical protein [Planctomycetota bacterium]
MNNLRLWIALLALTCFAAGVSAGLMLAPDEPGPARGSQPFDAYREAFVGRFRLSAERQRWFDETLRNYAAAIEDSRARVLARSRPELERELSEIGAVYQGFIRDHVVPPEQRAEFDELCGEWQTIQ